MCDCIAAIIDRTQQRECAVDAIVGSFNSQSSEVGYRPITLAGAPSRHHRYISEPWKYCPWCGQQIEMPKEATPLLKDASGDSVSYDPLPNRTLILSEKPR